MKYFLVDAQFGHVGRNKYIIKTIATSASDWKEATYNVRFIPRVKHNRKEAILNVKKVDYENYLSVKNENNDDMYFKVKSIQEQRKFCKDIEKNILLYEKVKTIKKRTKDYLKYKLKKQKEINKEFMFVLKNYEVIYDF